MDKKWYKGHGTTIGRSDNGQLGKVKVHYDGFNPKYDEWFNINSEHLARIFTHTHRDVPLHVHTLDSDDSDRDSSDRPLIDMSRERDQWRERFEVDLRLDIYDRSMSAWYQGRVIVLGTEDNGYTGKVKVHYDGYVERYDEWLNCNSQYLAPIFKHTQHEGNVVVMDPSLFETSGGSDAWRESIVLSQRLDIYDRAMSAWYKGRVIRLGTEDNGQVGKVRVHYDGYSEEYDEWLNCDSPYLAPLCKHTRSEMNSLAANAEREDFKSDQDETESEEDESEEESSS